MLFSEEESEYEAWKQKTEFTKDPHSLVLGKRAGWVQGAPEHTSNPWERWEAVWWWDKAAEHVVLRGVENCLQILHGMEWVPGLAKCSFAGAWLWDRDDQHSTFITLCSREEEGDINTNITNSFRRFSKPQSELWGEKWKGKNSEKTTCYESCTVTIDK